MFLNKIDISDDPEMHELVEMEVRELLSAYDYNGDDAIIVKGSALCALNGTDPEIGEKAIEELVKQMDETIEIPKRDLDKDFLMSIEQANNIAGRGTVAVGTIEQGKAKVGDEVEMIGFRRKSMTSIITGIETFHKSLDQGEAGDNVGMLLRGVVKTDIKRGMCLVKPGS